MERCYERKNIHYGFSRRNFVIASNENSFVVFYFNFSNSSYDISYENNQQKLPKGFVCRLIRSAYLLTAINFDSANEIL